jgi:hypothetical protein
MMLGVDESKSVPGVISVPLQGSSNWEFGQPWALLGTSFSFWDCPSPCWWKGQIIIIH